MAYILKKIGVFCLLLILCSVMCIGYATISDKMLLSGSLTVDPPVMPDVYITGIAPDSSAGVTVNETSGTVMFASVSGSGTATFTVNVINISDKIYIFDRVIDGAEASFEGAYSGTEITYELSGIKRLDELAPNGGTRSFNVTITVPRGVTAENYILNFRFIEKQGTEILPGNDEYDITFKYNNGQPDVTVKAHENDFLERPEAPSRDGYTFIGWYTDTTYTTAWNFEADTVKGTMTLYAGWEENAPTEYVVTFVPRNGDSNSIAVVAAGSLIPLPTSPVRDGYTFIGWYTDSACTSAWNFDTDKISSNMMLYAGWEIYIPPVPPECNITFRPNNGEPDTTIIVMTGDFIPRPTVPTRDGYTFIGWYTDEACTVAWNFEVDKVEGHMTLYGGWEQYVEVIVEYTVTFNPGNGSSSTTVTVVEGELIPIPNQPTREGYTFIGWYTDEACTTPWNFDTDKPTSNMTLYGSWQKTVAPNPGDSLHSDFMGLVEALLSKSNNCLNHSDLIFDAVMESLTSKKRPKEDAPILHCSVNSVSGGTMSSIASFANAKLTANLHFIFEVDPDPAYQSKRMRLYMYYGDDCVKAEDGDEILVYLQIVSRGSDGVWYADGTYKGTAEVGDFFGGGNAGKDVKTINPYTWKSTATAAE